MTVTNAVINLFLHVEMPHAKITFTTKIKDILISINMLIKIIAKQCSVTAWEVFLFIYLLKMALLLYGPRLKYIKGLSQLWEFDASVMPHWPVSSPCQGITCLFFQCAAAL